jgi:hypothetical protein
MFNAALSSTYKYNGSNFAISYGDGSNATGFRASDNVGIAGLNIRNQTIALITYTSNK